MAKCLTSIMAKLIMHLGQKAVRALIKPSTICMPSDKSKF